MTEQEMMYKRAEWFGKLLEDLPVEKMGPKRQPGPFPLKMSSRDTKIEG